MDIPPTEAIDHPVKYLAMDPVSNRIEAFNKHLLPNMVALKYQAMAESPFRFFRGTCHLFYEDLSGVKTLPASPPVWASGDLHLENFGSFKGDNRMVYFDLNDFDESALCPLNWELARILTSIHVAFTTLKLKSTAANAMASLFLNKYVATLKAGKAIYVDPRTASGIVRDFLVMVKKRKGKELLKKVTGGSGRQLRIDINNLTHFKLESKLKNHLTSYISEWIGHARGRLKDYKVVDAAFRVAGTGSIGLKRYMFLLHERKDKDKYGLIELKQVRQSSLSPYNTIAQPTWTSEAERVTITKYRMQNVSPALLSIMNYEGNQYVLQEMQPTADKIKFELLVSDPKEIRCVLEYMALLTASAQLRSGGIQGSATIDELTAYAKQDNWQRPLLDYAKTYAQQVKKDYKEYLGWFAAAGHHLQG